VFISFGMFIALIIATIIMILLIIYLTFTSGKSKTSRHDRQIQAEEEAKTRLAQNNSNLTESRSAQTNDSSFTEETDHTLQQNTHFQHDAESINNSIEEDDQLHVLPYPKDDDFNR
jgi:ABC-type multidrug transport system fused ATPase/permease subunit